MSVCLLCVSVPLWFNFGTQVAAQPEAPKKERYEYRKNVDPDGTGKYYLGRQIAPVMSYHGAGWLERPEREKEEEASKLYPPLKIKAGDFVCDMGAGSGYHTMRLVKLVGPKGKVYGVDVQPEMLAILDKRLNYGAISDIATIPLPSGLMFVPLDFKAQRLTNVQLVKGTEKDPKLSANSLDLILMVDVYHEFTYPYEMTEAMVKALKPGGRLVFVEYRLEDPDVPIKVLHRMAKRQVMKEMEAFPVRHVETLSHLPWQHVIIFEKKKTEKKEEKKQP